MANLFDTFVAYKFIKLLSTPFDKTDAYKLGIIDADGNILRKRKSLINSKDKKAYPSNVYTLVWNLKKILMKVPIVKSRLGQFAAALYLLKEETGCDYDMLLEAFSEHTGINKQNLVLTEQGKANAMADKKIILEGHIEKSPAQGADVSDWDNLDIDTRVAIAEGVYPNKSIAAKLATMPRDQIDSRTFQKLSEARYGDAELEWDDMPEDERFDVAEIAFGERKATKLSKMKWARVSPSDKKKIIKTMEDETDGLVTIKESKIEIGSKVHLGNAGKGGSGVIGVVTKIAGKKVTIENDKGDLFSGPMDRVTLKEAKKEMSARDHYRKVMKGGKDKRFSVVSAIDRERYPRREAEGLEGPYRSRKSGKVYYYDTKAGEYYDPDSDMYLDRVDVMEKKNVEEKMTGISGYPLVSLPAAYRFPFEKDAKKFVEGIKVNYSRDVVAATRDGRLVHVEYTDPDKKIEKEVRRRVEKTARHYKAQIVAEERATWSLDELSGKSEINEWWEDQAHPRSRGWKNGKVVTPFQAYNSGGEQVKFEAGDDIFYHPVTLQGSGVGKKYDVVVAASERRNAKTYFAVNPKHLGLKGYQSVTGEAVEIDEKAKMQDVFMYEFPNEKSAMKFADEIKKMNKLNAVVGYDNDVDVYADNPLLKGKVDRAAKAHGGKFTGKSAEIVGESPEKKSDGLVEVDLRDLATKGMGTLTAKQARQTVGKDQQFFSKDGGKKLTGVVVKVSSTHYTIRDIKTKQNHTFKVYDEKQAKELVTEAWTAQTVDDAAKSKYGITITPKMMRAAKKKYWHMTTTKDRGDHYRVQLQVKGDDPTNISGTADEVAAKLNDELNLTEAADDRTVVAKELKKWAKQYVEGPISVKSGSGKTPYIQLTARNGKIDNKLRKMVMDTAYPKASNVGDMDDISYGNVTDRYIAITADKWKEVMGMTEDAPATNTGGVAGTGNDPVVGVPTSKKKKKKAIARTKSMTEMNNLPKKHDLVSEYKGVKVFQISAEEFEATTNRRKYQRWNESDSFVAIKRYSLKNPTSPVIVQNEETGEMKLVRRKMNDGRLRHNRK